MSRLGLGLGITKGGVIPFNPLSLDPYLLFDTQSSMIGTFENPTLDLDPSVPSTLDVITATRAGVATYTDADGLIQSATPNTVRVDYTQGAELTPTVYQRVGYTDFSSGWGAFGGFTVQSASDFGGQPAIRLVSDGTSSNYYQFEIQNTEEQQQYVFSFYCRRVSGSGDIAARHALSVTGSSTSITVTANWQRVSVTCLGRTGGGSIFVGLIQSTGDGVYEFSQPQVEEGTTATDFVANTTGSPKFITGATYADRVPMILVEPSATNTIRWSEDSTAYNYGSGITFETSDVLAPNGQASAFKMTPDGSSVLHRRGSSYSGSYNANDVVTTSVWLKTDGYDYFLKVGGFFGAESAMFDSVDGSVQSTEGSVISASSEDYGNGWFRYKVTYTFQNQINNGLLYSGVRLVERDASNNPVESFDGTGDTTGVLVYGTQFELGSVATSYIPTDNDISGVTRAADDLVISGSAFSSFYNGAEGTFYLEAIDRDPTSGTHSFLRGQSEHRDFLFKYNGTSIHSFDGSTGVNQSGIAANQLFRAAVSYKSGSRTLSLNGTSPADGSLNTNWSTADRLRIGNGNAVVANMHVKRVIFWPYHKDNL